MAIAILLVLGSGIAIAIETGIAIHVFRTRVLASTSTLVLYCSRVLGYLIRTSYCKIYFTFQPR